MECRHGAVGFIFTGRVEKKYNRPSRDERLVRMGWGEVATGRENNIQEAARERAYHWQQEISY